MKKWTNYLLGACLLLAATACSEELAQALDGDGEIDATTAQTDTLETWQCDLELLRVSGRTLVNESNVSVTLHGFAQTPSPYFNNGEWADYDVDACLSYQYGMVDALDEAGWHMTFVRQHMDPYWCSDAASEDQVYRHFYMEDFVEAFENVYLPMAQYANDHGLYVVMRPPGVCPEVISAGDAFNQYLCQVWGYVSRHPKVRNNPGIMFELANEPVSIEGTDGSLGSSTDEQFEALREFLQVVVDTIRANGANNVIWLPGLGYQSTFAKYAQHPVQGDNLGLAIHCYPGWMGSDAISDSGEGLYDGTTNGYAGFQSGWDKQLGEALALYPGLVTEMDWSNGDVYPDMTWGQGVTGTAGGSGFGANFKFIADNCGNVSFLLFTGGYDLAKVDDSDPEDGVYDFYNDPQNSCVRTGYQWFREYYAQSQGDTKGDVLSLTAYIDGVAYAEGDTVTLKTGATSQMVLYATYANGSTEPLLLSEPYTLTSTDAAVASVVGNSQIAGNRDGYATLSIAYYFATLNVVAEVSSFPYEKFQASIYGTGNTFSQTTRRLITDAFGCGGWVYSDGIDLSNTRYLVLELTKGSRVDGANSVRIYDENNYWATPAVAAIDGYRTVVDLQALTKEDGTALDLGSINIIGFWTWGGEESQIIFNNIYVTNDLPTDTYIAPDEPEEPVEEVEEEEEVDPTPYVEDPNDYVFPLAALDPSIYSDGTWQYDEENDRGTLCTGLYGFGGWYSTEAIDLSGYRYLVVDCWGDEVNTWGGAQFRLYDQDNYWTSCACFYLAGLRTVIDLTDQQLSDPENFVTVNPATLHYVGFWSYGDPIYIKRIFATNNEY